MKVLWDTAGLTCWYLSLKATGLEGKWLFMTKCFYLSHQFRLATTLQEDVIIPILQMWTTGYGRLRNLPQIKQLRSSRKGFKAGPLGLFLLDDPFEGRGHVMRERHDCFWRQRASTIVMGNGGDGLVLICFYRAGKRKSRSKFYLVVCWEVNIPPTDSFWSKCFWANML